MREVLDITLEKTESLTGLPFLADTGAISIATACDWHCNGMRWPTQYYKCSTINELTINGRLSVVCKSVVKGKPKQLDFKH